MMLISDTLKVAIWEQISHEIYNSNLYLYMCGVLKNKGLDKLASHFEKQRDEELEHSKEFFNLLTDLSTNVRILEIEEVEDLPFSTISDLAKFYLEAEILTTNTINEIKKMAIQENNPIVEEKMREMIFKQQHEYEEATSFLDNALLCEGADSWWKAKVWNDSL